MNRLSKKNINIIGIRGVPANHGGFETFAEILGLYLNDNQWNVTIYCQEKGKKKPYESQWKGIKRVHISTNINGPIGTIIYDFKTIIHLINKEGIVLMLGYNTAIFSIVLKIFKKNLFINMDGIEWKRDKWNLIAKIWFWINEQAGYLLGNHLIADHPEIKNHLKKPYLKKKITMIPYGAERITKADEKIIHKYKLKQNEYSLIIARPEPENSILEIVEAYSEKRRNHKLVILGEYLEHNSYHEKVKKTASDEVVFLGAIYDKLIVNSLRYHSKFYFHGHKVGGTNPSLIEALGAGQAVLAHDNKFNRWVVNNKAYFFKTNKDLKFFFDTKLHDIKFAEALKSDSIKNFEQNFQWKKVLKDYEKIFK